MAGETIKEEEASRVSPLTATRSHLAQGKLASVCCTCCEQCNGSKSKHSSTVNYKKAGSQAQQLRDTLQVYLMRTQVEETVMDDKQKNLMQHLSLISNACEAVIQHMQSLQISYLVVKRIFDMSHALLACHPPSSANCIHEDFTSHYRQIEIEKEKKISSLRELTECCSRNIVFSKDVCALLDDHRDRRKDFFLASANFKNLLENSRLSVSQMEKLQRQYDTILMDFQQSRRFLDAELPKIIDLRLEALQQIFHNIAELYGHLDYNMNTATLFKLIAVNLRQVNPDIPEKIVIHEQEASKEMCQKSKMDCTDKK